jgi:hypothetical protein
MLARSCVIAVALASIGTESIAVAQGRLFPAQQIAPSTPDSQQPSQPSVPSFQSPQEPKPLLPNQSPRQQPIEETADAAKTRVVCGMTVIPANPKSDPKFVIPPPPPQSGRVFKPTIRTVPPVICR